MIKKILLTVLGIIAGVFIIGAFQSKDMFVIREIQIAANPEIIFPYINSAEKAYEWMPWADGDPGIEINFSGPSEGVGSKSSWNGKQMGVGISEVIESNTNRVVKTKLDYTEPFEMSQIAEISLTPTDDGTMVKWSITGQKNYLFRVMGIFMDCDKMVGGEFEKGLKRLKSLTESK